MNCFGTCCIDAAFLIRYRHQTIYKMKQTEKTSDLTKGDTFFLRCNVHFVTEFSVTCRTGILFFAFFWRAKAWSARISLTWKREKIMSVVLQATYYSVAPVFITPCLPQLGNWYVTKPPPLSGHFLSCSINSWHVQEWRKIYISYFKTVDTIKSKLANQNKVSRSA